MIRASLRHARVVAHAHAESCGQALRLAANAVSVVSAEVREVADQAMSVHLHVVSPFCAALVWTPGLKGSCWEVAVAAAVAAVTF